MSKNTLAFISVVIFSIILLVAYFTAPLSTKPIAPSPKTEQLQLQNQTSDTGQGVPIPKEKLSSGPVNESPRAKIYDQSQEIIKSTPTKVIVRYRTQQSARNIKFLTVYMNDIPTEVIFDTGASFTTVNSQTMNQLRILTPLRPSISNTASGPTPSFLFNVASIRIGSLELKNVQCSYLPATSENLLGGSFLSNFHYYINEQDQTITFIPNSENVRITNNNTMEPVSGTGWAEIDGKKFIYNEGHMEKQ